MGALVTTGLLGLMTIFGVLAVSSARQATQQALNERLTLTWISADALDAMLLHTVDDLTLFAQLPRKIPQRKLVPTGMGPLACRHPCQNQSEINHLLLL